MQGFYTLLTGELSGVMAAWINFRFMAQLSVQILFRE